MFSVKKCQTVTWPHQFMFPPWGWGSLSRCDLLMGAASGEHLLVLLNRYACGVAAAVAQLAGALVVQQGPLLTCRDHPCVRVHTEEAHPWLLPSLPQPGPF